MTLTDLEIAQAINVDLHDAQPILPQLRALAEHTARLMREETAREIFSLAGSILDGIIMSYIPNKEQRDLAYRIWNGSWKARYLSGQMPQEDQNGGNGATR